MQFISEFIWVNVRWKGPTLQAKTMISYFIINHTEIDMLCRSAYSARTNHAAPQDCRFATSTKKTQTELNLRLPPLRAGPSNKLVLMLIIILLIIIIKIKSSTYLIWWSWRHPKGETKTNVCAGVCPLSQHETPSWGGLAMLTTPNFSLVLLAGNTTRAGQSRCRLLPRHSD